jgi:hypothetical protein
VRPIWYGQDVAWLTLPTFATFFAAALHMHTMRKRASSFTAGLCPILLPASLRSTSVIWLLVNALNAAPPPPPLLVGAAPAPAPPRNAAACTTACGCGSIPAAAGIAVIPAAAGPAPDPAAGPAPAPAAGPAPATGAAGADSAKRVR